VAGGVLIHEDSAKRIFGATRIVEGNPLDLTSKVQRRREQLNSTKNKHYFYPKKTATDKITVVDGFDLDNANCGQISVNRLALSPVAVLELTITADAFIYLECVGVGDPLTSSTNTIVQYADEQSWEAGKSKKLISRVLFTDTAITDFSIEKVDGEVFIIGVCT
jgi:hypothetical protein